MLVALRVKNFAIVEDGTLDFAMGMTAFTGETGAGKSLLFDAITLLLGAKAKSDLVRTGCTNAEVEGVFDVSQAPEQRQRLEELGFEVDPADGSLLLVRREFSASDVAKNRIWIQGLAATRKQLQEVLGDLVEISGQHEFLKLGREDFLLSLVDQYGGLKADVQDFERLYQQAETIKKELKEIEDRAGQRDTRIDFLKFQIEEFERAGIAPGLVENEAEWMALRNRLGSMEKLRLALDKSLLAFEGSEGDGDSSVPGALAQISLVGRELRAFENVGSEFKTLTDCAEDLHERSQDLAYKLRQALNGLEADPQALDEAETRLSHLTRLKRKYNADTEGLLSLMRDYQSELARLDRSEENIAELRERHQTMQKHLVDAAQKLHERRGKAAAEMQKLWERDIRLLGMPQAEMRVEVEKLPESRSRGFSRVQVLFCANPGERLNPVGKVASGGELSRIMLALKNIVAGRSEVGVYLFDEVDAGIGGETAQRVAERLQHIASENQVLVVTHLASIAAHASSQFLIAKETLKGRTRTLIRPLAKDERPREIARMLGESQSKAALLLAEELLERAQKGSSSSTPKKTAAPVAKAKSAAPAKASAKDNGKKKIASAKPVRRARDAEA
jgi:DNA repair protein RecN (Recombination protein N)